MQAIPSSFRDKSGYVFLHEGMYYRAIHNCYKNAYEHLMGSGLYEHLQKKKLLIPHHEILEFPKQDSIETIIRPEQIKTISYAWEWTFSMLQDAAICTLDNALEALNFGMILKDANTHNIQFAEGKPVLIDTLSFDLYHEYENWIAYRQFCECFIAPLLLMKYAEPSLNKLLQAFPNGIPLSVCAAILPLKSRLNVHVNLHIFLQYSFSAKKQTDARKATSFSIKKMKTLLLGLMDFISGLKLHEDHTTWDHYYNETILSQHYLDTKKKHVRNLLEKISFKTLLDLGANEGEFSLLYKNTDKHIIAMDADRNCMEKLYVLCRKQRIKNVHPLIIDLMAPSPDLGWNNNERTAVFKRINADITLALALVHHLAITHNIPLQKVISFLHPLSTYLLIEFVPKTDDKVQQLLKNRTDIFDTYSVSYFKKEIALLYEILDEVMIEETERTLFLLKRK